MHDESISKRKFINVYIKYTAKTPTLVIAMIVFFVSLILCISLTTKTNLYQTFDGALLGESIVIEKEIDTLPEVVYIYENRNEAVFPVNIEYFETKDYTTILSISCTNDAFRLTSSENFKIDVLIGEITLFERVFMKGGKVNG